MKDKNILEMGTIAKDDQQVTLYYNSESAIGKQTYAYITASSKEIQPIDVTKEKVTGTQWAALADKLNVDIADFIDTDHPKFQEMYGDKDVDLNETDWIKVLQEQPEVISWPIVVNGNQFLLVKNPSDIVKHINQ
ncbi:arsenate reductase family protein [Sediminicola sp. 1XM1-17]|uniref:arsenate reductase family protein n=1 Tax=Sediminicola sp. 1XM1-17 TaxID=3127702 RepID=UPI00307688F2